MYNWIAGMGVFAIILGIALTIFWVWMLIEALTKEPTTGDKLLWFLVVFLLPVIGSIIYFVMRPNGVRHALT